MHGSFKETVNPAIGKGAAHLSGSRLLVVRRVGALACALLLGSASLAACSSEGRKEEPGAPSGPVSTDYFGYLLNTKVSTSNAGTAFGAAASAAQQSNRLYPAVFMPGPSGQLIPNTDLAETEELAPLPDNNQRRILYTLAENANFSDGTPVTCDDFLLSYKAGSMAEEFGSHLPLAKEVSGFFCEPGNKKFMVAFNENQGERWRYLFGPGTVMPSHALAAKAGLSQEQLYEALVAEDAATLEPVAQAWRDGFSLQRDDFDPQLQVSYGPFVIERIGEDGEIVFKANKEYYGDQPELDHVVAWPADTDVQRLVDAGALKVADAPSTTPAWLSSAQGAQSATDSATNGAPDKATDKTTDGADDNFEVTPETGFLTDTLSLSKSGVFTQASARQAFAACIDQPHLAKVSSQKSGVDVPPVLLRTLRSSDPLAASISGVGEGHKATDMSAAASLAGQTIRIGYRGPDERYGAMVEEISKACEPAGITVEDKSAEYMSQAFLELDPATSLPTIDAFLGPVDPMSEYPAADADIRKVNELRAAEEALWEDVPTIPIAAQPRVFVVDRSVAGVVPYTGLAGIGWNMDRWRDTGTEETESTQTRTKP